MVLARIGAVLMAEDDDNEAFFLQRAFTHEKVSNPLRRVRDGVEAVEYLRGEGPYADREKHPLPDLLLLDLKMPRKNGFEVLEWVRQQPGLKRLPIVVLTSSMQDLDINRAYELGANTYLVKPANYEALVELVRTLIQYWLVMAITPVMET
jgi:CheY-like chemotaxis protein